MLDVEDSIIGIKGYVDDKVIQFVELWGSSGVKDEVDVEVARLRVGK
jgi:hypothetical protein